MVAKKSTVIATLVSTLGLALLVVSAFVEGWLQGLLLNVGTACLLAIPLVWVERQLERSERRTKEVVEDLRADVEATQAQVRQSLEEMAAIVTQGEAEREAGRHAAVEEIAAQPSQEIVREVLRFAAREQAISDRGIRVKVEPGFPHYLRFWAANVDTVGVSLERRDGESPGRLLMWHRGESPAEFMLRVSDELSAESVHPGARFDGGSRVFASLSQAISVVREVKRRFQGLEKISGAVEVCGDQWMICDWGLCGWHDALQPYSIENDRLFDDDLLSHMSEKEWVDIDQFRYALETARLLKRSGRLHEW